MSISNNINTDLRNDNNINDKGEEENDDLSRFEISEEDVIRGIKYLKTNKLVGSDGIPAKFYKLFVSNLAPIITYLFIEILRLGIIPSRMKKTHIKCIYKGKKTKRPKCKLQTYINHIGNSKNI